MRDFGRTTIKHLWIDLDSWSHSEVWLHVFRQQLSERNDDGEIVPTEKLIVVEEGGFGVGFGGREEVRMQVMSREDFKKEYGIDVPELFDEPPKPKKDIPNVPAVDDPLRDNMDII